MKEGILLAMDLSASVGSLALLSPEGEVLARDEWEEPPRGSSEFWRKLSAAIQRFGADTAPWTGVAVGRGPGRYTGIRTGIIVARMLAFIDPGIEVKAIDSGAALALGAIRGRPSVPGVMVAGDARRGQCWIRYFHNVDGWPEADHAWSVGEPSEIHLPAGAIGVSPEWSRLESSLRGPWSGWIREDCAPDATHIGLLARRTTGITPTEPVQPLYLHPAVAAPKGKS